MLVMSFDVIIKNGLCFDGTGAPGERVNVGIRDGRVVVKSAEPLDETGCGEVIDASGQWVMPGFVDLHTHYDAELIAAPSLGESVRHGVTTVTVGSCSISTILSDAGGLLGSLHARRVGAALARAAALAREEDVVDAARVRRLPARASARPERHDVPRSLRSARARARPRSRRRSRRCSPTRRELAEMERWLEEALDAGFLGLSTMTNPWDKLDGDRFRSAQLPSTYATWSEYRRLHDVLRRRERILQSRAEPHRRRSTRSSSCSRAPAFFFRQHAEDDAHHARRREVDARAAPHHRAAHAAREPPLRRETFAGRRCRCRSRSTPTASISSSSKSSARARRCLHLADRDASATR